MKLATITTWAYGATVIVTLISGAAMLFASQTHEAERAAVQQRYELDQATAQLRDEVFRLTSQARQYTVDGDPSHLVVYRREVDGLGSVEDRIAQIGDAGAGRDELNALAEAIKWADTLHDEHEAAIAAYQAGDEAKARMILFGAEYERELGRIEAAIERFQYRLDERTARKVEDATESARMWRTISEIMLALTAMMFLNVLYFVLTRRILKPVLRLSDVVTRLAAQDYAVDPPDYTHVDEIGDMAAALRVFQETGLERQRLERLHKEEMRIRELMSRMMQRMQNCDTLDELSKVIVRFVPDITSGRAGRLYLRDKDRNALACLCDWLDPLVQESEFSPLSCWALRRGSLHRFSNAAGDMPCEHLRDFPAELHDTVCVPLEAQQENIGLLCIEGLKAERSEGEELSDSYLDMLAENISLAVANLNLRAELSDMAMLDPLTGLSNRRKLEQVLARYHGNNAPDRVLSCLIMDVDHFKRFNDQFGHDAGDEVLRHVGAELKASVRDGAMAFRYGGEEFVVLIPGLEAEAAVERAQFIRSKIASLNLNHEGRNLGQITVSVGVAGAPGHCAVPRLVQTADAALLRAKEEGRDRVVVASQRREGIAA